MPTSLRRSEPCKRPGGPGGHAKDANQKSAKSLVQPPVSGTTPMSKETKGYLIIAGISLLTAVIYKVALKPALVFVLPGSLQAYLP